ncbi:hypothetical protein R0H03_10135 [Pediococcus acidilactici]|uniref:Phage protein n=1 Tax=Pediococcus acidilactici TaxID=1254 RepID=A0AAW8YP04_PEDAC|nr:hypothetical protein [Pediococcus acidilactici]MDV2912188.1 hypothetical protein [Pediococcus acidilactici]WQS18321.1 hypothetical protein SGW14_04610 [Pediococcus acidilactici]
MRFTDRVRFYKSNDHYDPSNPSGEPVMVGEVIANVTHLGVDRSQQLFGSIDVDRLVVRLVEPVNDGWDLLTINGGKTYYKLETGVHPLKIMSYIVGETQNE